MEQLDVAASAPLLSVIIPTAHFPNTLPVTLAKTSTALADIDHEILVAVSDPSRLNVALKATSLFSNVKVLVASEPGPGSARNAGIETSRGDWVLFLDDDDEIVGESLKLLLSKRLPNSDVEVISCGYQIVSREGVQDFPAGCKSPEDLVLSRPLAFWRNLYSGAFLRDRDIRFPRGFVGEDLVFVCRVVAADPRVQGENAIVYSYHQHEGGLSSVRDSRWLIIPDQLNLAFKALEGSRRSALWLSVWETSWLSSLLSLPISARYAYLTRLASLIRGLPRGHVQSSAIRIMARQVLQATVRRPFPQGRRIRFAQPRCH